MRRTRSRRPSRRVVSSLDHRIEAVSGHDVDILWNGRNRGVVDDQRARLANLHRDSAEVVTAVTFYRTLLHRCSGGEFPIDAALFARIDRTVDQAAEAADGPGTARSHQ